MGQVFGIGIAGVQAGGLMAQAQTAAMTGQSVALVFAPVVSVITAIVSVVTLVLSGNYLLI